MRGTRNADEGCGYRIAYYKLLGDAVWAVYCCTLRAPRCGGSQLIDLSATSTGSWRFYPPPTRSAAVHEMCAFFSFFLRRVPYELFLPVLFCSAITITPGGSESPRVQLRYRCTSHRPSRHVHRSYIATVGDTVRRNNRQGLPFQAPR